MKNECPHCGGRLIEKHSEEVTERGQTTKLIHLRCLNCGKWTKYEEPIQKT
ncbi:MAG: hypothetical protein ACTSUO_06430 [Candidatus Thorarchaeota archaeon]